MQLIRQLGLALLGAQLFFESSIAVAHNSYQPEIKKRAPPEVENWALYKYWNSQIETSPYFCEAGFSADTGSLSRSGNVRSLSWGIGNCEEKIVSWDFKQTPIAKGEVSIWKATLKVKNSDGTEKSSKEVALKRGSDARGILFGANVQQKLSDNDNILGALEAVVQNDEDGDPEWGNSIMPFVQASSLEKNLDSYSTQSLVNDAFKQILTAVSVVHGEGIMHRDLKPENFLVDGSILKLIDFDTAFEGDSTNAFNVGTRTYAAPEIVAMKTPSGGGYTKKIDVFSLGMTFLVMSVTDLQDDDTRFLLWKELIEPNGELWPTVAKVSTLLKEKSYDVFSDNENLLTVISTALCTPDDRYDDASAFQTAFNAAI
ncbi:hypothetical protein N7448_007347 [Penicillium atrosanguineum]|uniref:non-specific serine/threonine protein kinase n=1 Tax=Penicillium atrosanguineum TaxID=1132637 RepID=A0A9W9GP37_9EURO|nr:glycosyl hydrolase family 15 [Penicillium atrosanguineum]KAJ5126568.1 hypothetical protein N7448_007347 [Penicillium atrosanguineum]KAJ5146768.1 hypothetical protein N7526_000120 [Penicillium atrosanguineum]KAJ5314741.1 glycosyl hydrolase family 15 [Penicillium atrosanguineum]KAJ5331911.1 hypothetical protein N7476_001694 [Penicillium atrosanguineum]